MKGKRGLAITNPELFKIGILIIITVGLWFVTWGIRELIIETFNLTIPQSIVVGFVILGGVLLFTRFK